MNLLKNSLFLIFFLLIFIPGVQAQQITFNDLNLVSRDVSVYACNSSGTYLISSGTTANETLDLSNDYSYQVIIEPNKNTWFDNPENAIKYFFSESAGQTLTFIVFALAFGGFTKIVFR